jgi:hypothetical protein
MAVYTSSSQRHRTSACKSGATDPRMADEEAEYGGRQGAETLVEIVPVNSAC